MYFTNLQTIINYSQEELHLHYNFMVVSDNSINVDVETEDTAFPFSSFSNLYRCKVVMGQRENQAFLFKNIMQGILIVFNNFLQTAFSLEENRFTNRDDSVFHAIRW